MVAWLKNKLSDLEVLEEPFSLSLSPRYINGLGSRQAEFCHQLRQLSGVPGQALSEQLPSSAQPTQVLVWAF